MNALTKAEANVASAKKLIEAAEIWFEAHGAEDHPVFNNDVYDNLYDAERYLKAVKRASLSGRVCSNTSNLISGNMD